MNPEIVPWNVCSELIVVWQESKRNASSVGGYGQIVIKTSNSRGPAKSAGLSAGTLLQQGFSSLVRELDDHFAEVSGTRAQKIEQGQGRSIEAVHEGFVTIEPSGLEGREYLIHEDRQVFEVI